MSDISYLRISAKDIQNTPPLASWAPRASLRAGVHFDELSDQSPFHEKRPHGLRSLRSLHANNDDIIQSQ